MSSTRLERSATNRVIGGVCGGIAEYLQVDATLIRVFFVIAAVFTAGLFFLAYVVLLVLMPMPGLPAPFVQQTVQPPASPAADPSDPASATTRIAPPPPPIDPETAERRRATIGFFLIAIGAVFLLGNLGAFRIVRWDVIWPLVLVGIGVLLLAQRARR